MQSHTITATHTIRCPVCRSVRMLPASAVERERVTVTCSRACHKAWRARLSTLLRQFPDLGDTRQFGYYAEREYVPEAIMAVIDARVHGERPQPRQIAIPHATGRKPKLTAKAVYDLRQQHAAGCSARTLATQYHISVANVYRLLQKGA